jgi:murein DD-endopeptidase MepM/ murein hydrolase activator NlpD
MAILPYPRERTLFSDRLVECNGLRKAGFEEWAFYPGMLFGARRKWWGDRGRRLRPHEGIDLCFFAGKAAGHFRLDESSRIPAMFDGEVLGVEEDFLGRSLFLGHDIDDGQGRRLFTIYGHTAPGSRVRTGRRLRQGEILGSLSKTDGNPAGVLPHLHLSMAWVSTACGPDGIDWARLHAPGVAVFLDPLHAIEGPHKTLRSDAPVKLPSYADSSMG